MTVIWLGQNTNSTLCIRYMCVFAWIYSTILWRPKCVSNWVIAIFRKAIDLRSNGIIVVLSYTVDNVFLFSYVAPFQFFFIMLHCCCFRLVCIPLIRGRNIQSLLEETISEVIDQSNSATRPYDLTFIQGVTSSKKVIVYGEHILNTIKKSQSQVVLCLGALPDNNIMTSVNRNYIYVQIGDCH